MEGESKLTQQLFEALGKHLRTRAVELGSFSSAGADRDANGWFLYLVGESRSDINQLKQEFAGYRIESYLANSPKRF